MQRAESMRHRTVSKMKSDHQNGLWTNLGDDVKSNRTSKAKPSTLHSPMSKYEMMLEEKRAKNRKFLESLEIGKAKSNLDKVINSMKVKQIRKPREKSDSVTQRTSKRLKKQLDYLNKVNRSDSVIQRTSKKQKGQFDYAEVIDSNALGLSQKFCPTETNFKKALKYNTSSQFEHFMKDFSEIIEADDIVIEDPVLYNKNILKQLSPKVSSMRVPNTCAISWFPSAENLILAVGDGNGNVNLSNFKESYLDFHVFSVHTKGISNVQYNPFNSFQLFSSGMDGKLLCCDMQAQKFSEVLNTSKSGYTDFDFIAPSSYIVSLTNGEVIILDSREYRARELRYFEGHQAPVSQKTAHSLHRYFINTANVHPINKNYFVTTAKGDNKICIWDLRYLSRAVITNTSHTKNVVSAAFSPVSGKFLLSKSQDEIGIFDCTSMTRRCMECHKTMKCVNSSKDDFTTRPVWLPNTDDNFACNNVDSSSLHIFDKDFNVYETLPEDRGMRKKLFAFHPFQAALVCVTHTSKIYVYL